MYGTGVATFSDKVVAGVATRVVGGAAAALQESAPNEVRAKQAVVSGETAKSGPDVTRKALAGEEEASASLHGDGGAGTAAGLGDENTDSFALRGSIANGVWAE